MASGAVNDTSVKLDELPSELLLKILYYLDFRDLVNCSKVNRRLHDLSNHDAHWKYQCAKYWLENNCHSGNSWKNQFCKWYCEFKYYIDCFAVIKSTWDKIISFMEMYHPQPLQAVNNGVQESELDETEAKLNVKFPNDFRCAYRMHNGQRFHPLCWVQDMPFPNHYTSELLLSLTTALLTLERTQRTFGCFPLTYSISSKITQCITLDDEHGVEPGTVVSLPMDHYENFPEKIGLFISGQSFTEWFIQYAKSLEETGCVRMSNQLFRFAIDPTFEETTGFITVKVATCFAPKLSTIEPPYFVHAYRITMKMADDAPNSESCQLMMRHWIITDENGHEERVDGPGVVGHFPVMQPGTTFSWVSFTHFPTTYGNMKGHFAMKNLATGNIVHIACPIFHMKCLPYITRADRQAAKESKLLLLKKSQ